LDTVPYVPLLPDPNFYPALSCNKTHNLKEVVRLEACEFSRLLDKALANLQQGMRRSSVLGPEMHRKTWILNLISWWAQTPVASTAINSIYKGELTPGKPIDYKAIYRGPRTASIYNWCFGPTKKISFSKG